MYDKRSTERGLGQPDILNREQKKGHFVRTLPMDVQQPNFLTNTISKYLRPGQYVQMGIFGHRRLLLPPIITFLRANGGIEIEARTLMTESN